MVISIILSVALGLVVAFAVASAMQLTANDGSFTYEVTSEGSAVARRKFAGFNRVGDGWWWAVGSGAIVGLINFFTPKIVNLLWLAPIFLVIMVIGYIALMVWWHKEGGAFSEMIPFIVLAVLCYFTTMATASMTAALIPLVSWRLVVLLVPKLLLVATLGFFIIDLLFFRYREIDDEGSGIAKRDHILGWVCIAITTAILIALLATGVAWGSLFSGGKKAYGTDGTTTTAQTNEWCKFYNTDLQKDGDDSNNFNFGPNPYADGKTAKDYDADFRERLKWDPALAAADTAWLDANVGTRYLGEFYESCKGDWAKTMNEAKVRFMNDQKAYYKNLDSYFAFLDSAVKVEVRECRSVSDQMYMNPYTADGVPDVIVLLTDDHSGHELVYTFEIKGNTFEVAYRIECGYQPTDVEAVMGITPQDKSTYIPSGGTPDTPTPNPPTPTPTPDPPGPTPDPPGPTPDPPGPTPTPEPKKDPSQLTPINTEPNDNTGPGENTIDPSDPNHSTADRPDNSTSYPSYDAYREDMDHLADVNDNQRVGGDSNQPSTETPSGTTVDNNAANGTGNGGIDKPTEVSKPAEEAGTGKPINDKPGDAWGDGTDPT